MGLLVLLQRLFGKKQPAPGAPAPPPVAAAPTPVPVAAAPPAAGAPPVQRIPGDVQVIRCPGCDGGTCSFVCSQGREAVAVVMGDLFVETGMCQGCPQAQPAGIPACIRNCTKALIPPNLARIALVSVPGTGEKRLRAGESLALTG